MLYRLAVEFVNRGGFFSLDSLCALTFFEFFAATLWTHSRAVAIMCPQHWRPKWKNTGSTFMRMRTDLSGP